jgi:hypothetical protein
MGYSSEWRGPLRLQELAERLTPEEIQSRAANRNDPLREFRSICRGELESLWNDL